MNEQEWMIEDKQIRNPGSIPGLLPAKKELDNLDRICYSEPEIEKSQEKLK